jgi:hypothetical protein
LTSSPGRALSPQYEFIYSSNVLPDNLFSFVIKCRATQTILFDTSLGGLVLNNQFLQIVTRLQSAHIYRFGENNHDNHQDYYAPTIEGIQEDVFIRWKHE